MYSLGLVCPMSYLISEREGVVTVSAEGAVREVLSSLLRRRHVVRLYKNSQRYRQYRRSEDKESSLYQSSSIVLTMHVLLYIA